MAGQEKDGRKSVFMRRRNPRSQNKERSDDFERKNKIERLPKKEDTEYSYLEDSLSEKLGTRVKIKKNKVQINFTNSNDLNRILEIMNLNK